MWSRGSRHGASHDKWRAIGIDKMVEDVNRIQVRWGRVTKEDVMQMDIRAESRGDLCFDIYILPRGHLRVELAGPPGNVDFRRGGSLLRFPVRIAVRAEGSRPDAVAALLVDGVQLLPDFVNCPREVLTWRILEEPVGHFGSGSPLGLPASIPLVGGCQFARV